MMEQFHEPRVLDDRDPQGVAFGLIQAFRDADDDTLKRLLAAAVGRGPVLFADTVRLLVDLAVPHQVSFEVSGPRQAHRRVQGLILARGIGLYELFDEIVATIRGFDAHVQAVHLAVLTQLVAGLVDAGHVHVPGVVFAEGSRS